MYFKELEAWFSEQMYVSWFRGALFTIATRKQPKDASIDDQKCYGERMEYYSTFKSKSILKQPVTWTMPREVSQTKEKILHV